jgi:hypothetical protein
MPSKEDDYTTGKTKSGAQPWSSSEGGDTDSTSASPDHNSHRLPGGLLSAGQTGELRSSLPSVDQQVRLHSPLNINECLQWLDGETHEVPWWHGQEELVISGVSGRFPESDTVEEFAEHLYNGDDLITDDNRRWEPGTVVTRCSLHPILSNVFVVAMNVASKQTEDFD